MPALLDMTRDVASGAGLPIARQKSKDKAYCPQDYPSASSSRRKNDSRMRKSSLTMKLVTLVSFAVGVVALLRHANGSKWSLLRPGRRSTVRSYQEVVQCFRVRAQNLFDPSRHLRSAVPSPLFRAGSAAVTFKRTCTDAIMVANEAKNLLRSHTVAR